MANQQIFNLSQLNSSSVSPADLLIVEDISGNELKNVSVGSLSDSVDGTIFLSASYAKTSSLAAVGNLISSSISSSFANYVSQSSWATNMSGSSVHAISSSFSHHTRHVISISELIEITSSSDYTSIYAVGSAGGGITFKIASPKGLYILSPTSHKDNLRSAIIGGANTTHFVGGLSSGSYGFNISNLLDSGSVLLPGGDSLNFSVDVVTTPSPSTYSYRTILFHNLGRVDYSVNSSNYAHTSSLTTVTASFSDFIHQTTSSRYASSVVYTTPAGTFAYSASLVVTASFTEKTSLSTTSSNGPAAGMIFLYAGIRPTGSEQWYNCDGGLYNSTAYTDLSSSLGSKFTVAGSGSARLPKLDSSLFSSSFAGGVWTNVITGSGPFNTKIPISQSVLGHPNNIQISMSHAGTYLVATYSNGTYNGSTLQNDGRAFYYNIRRQT